MDVKTFDNLLHDVEVKLKRLRALYEQYFQGIERLEPTVPRKDLDRIFHTLHKAKPRNTAARFKLQQLQASYNTYQAYWGRIVRQIEEGTYERDLRRVRRRNQARPAARSEVKAIELDVDVDEIETDEILAALEGLGEPAPAPAAKPAARAPLTAFSPFAGGLGTGKLPKTTPSPRAPSPPAPAVASSGAAAASPPKPSPPSGSLLDLDRPKRPARDTPATGVPAAVREARAAPPRPPSPPRPSPPRPPAPPATGRRPRPPPPPPGKAGGDARLKRLYDDYVAARRRNNEPTDNLHFEKLASSVQRMESKLRAKHKDKNIGFEVVVRDGRVGLKPKIE